MTAYIFKIITILGGLSLFLFGMDVMGKALERQALETHRRIYEALRDRDVEKGIAALKQDMGLFEDGVCPEDNA